ncbi:EF-hand domain-containing protein [Pseudooceanicola spongiae]|uniref:EF-hand domain-containing protein n=1 Tax=Pseudooceanicola spongiae TaxID=2613965 RepID=A0A7L9WPY1_9RHOB|nr:EF-hand domain-containing protein [Pseudooceanicola spongiae]QOL81992.1 hypothetical protein F3W81_14840 [Pseudooceanicola spongiae]
MRQILIPLALVLSTAAPALAQQADTGSETETADRPAPGVAGGHRKAAFIAAYDTDGDGAVALDEYNAIRKSRFDAADTDGDGALNEAEYVAEFQGRLDQQYADQALDKDDRYEKSLEQAHVRFAIVDRSRDGALSWAEQQLVAASTFSRHDTDENGVVDASDPIPAPEDDGTADTPTEG